jgi:hypothetical protein
MARRVLVVCSEPDYVFGTKPPMYFGEYLILVYSINRLNIPLTMMFFWIPIINYVHYTR